MPALESLEFTSPIGRAVQGSFFEPQTTNMKGEPLLIKNGPKKGQARVEYFAALAFHKSDPNWPAFEQTIKGYAARAWPMYWPQGPLGPCSHPNASIKIVDGDGVDGDGKPNRDKEGFAGHWIVRFSTGYAPTVYPAGRHDRASIITDGNLCKLGYFYRIAGTIASNEDTTHPGVYINFSAVELAGYGDEIVPKSAINPAKAFGQAAALPAGARPTPAGAAPVSGHTMAPGAPQQVASAPQPSAPSPTASHTNPPYAGYMQAGAPPAPTAPPAPAAPPAGPQMTPAAAGVTYDAYRKAGWTDDQLRQNGLMV